MESVLMREIRGRVPFRPFVIGLVDGRRFSVPHPDFMTISQSGRHVVVYDEENRRNTYIDTMLIITGEVSEPSSPPFEPPTDSTLSGGA